MAGRPLEKNAFLSAKQGSAFMHSSVRSGAEVRTSEFLSKEHLVLAIKNSMECAGVREALESVHSNVDFNNLSEISADSVNVDVDSDNPNDLDVGFSNLNSLPVEELQIIYKTVEECRSLIEC